MQDDLLAKLVTEVGEFAEVGEHKVARGLEKAPVCLEVEIHNVLSYRVDDLRVGVHRDEVVLHAEKVGSQVEKRTRHL